MTSGICSLAPNQAARSGLSGSAQKWLGRLQPRLSGEGHDDRHVVDVSPPRKPAEQLPAEELAAT